MARIRPLAAGLGLAAVIGALALWRESRDQRPDPEASAPAVEAPRPAEQAADGPLNELLDPAPAAEARAEPAVDPAVVVARVVALPDGPPTVSVILRSTSGAPIEASVAPGSSVELACAPGAHRITAASRDGAWVARERSLELLPGERRSIELVPLRRHALRGDLFDREGRPVSDLAIAAVQDDEIVAVGATGPAGEFELDSLLEGSCEIVLGDPEAPIEFSAISVEEDGFVHLQSPALHVLEIFVRDSRHEPVAAAQVVGVGSNGGRVAIETDPSGHARVAQLPPGEYRLTATHRQFGHAEHIAVIGFDAVATVQIDLATW